MLFEIRTRGPDSLMIAKLGNSGSALPGHKTTTIKSHWSFNRTQRYRQMTGRRLDSVAISLLAGGWHKLYIGRASRPQAPGP